MGSRIIGIAILAALGGGVAAPLAAQDEDLPPVETYEPGTGKWISQADATIQYAQEIGPKTTANLLSMKCELFGLKMSLIGLEPLQRFPQPWLVVRFDDKEYSIRPTPAYVPGFEFDMLRPKTRAKLESEVEVPSDFMRTVSPPFAVMDFKLPADAEDLPALLAAEAITLDFAGQKRVFPPIPVETAQTMVGQCGRSARERIQILSRQRSEQYARMIETKND